MHAKHELINQNGLFSFSFINLLALQHENVFAVWKLFSLLYNRAKSIQSLTMLYSQYYEF